MKEIQLKELMRIVKFIESIGCEFKIISPDGHEFGRLETAPARTRSKRQYKYGEVAGFFRPHLDLNAQIGSVQEISTGSYKPITVQSGICADLTKSWGKDSYVTSINKNGDKIEVLRTK